MAPSRKRSWRRRARNSASDGTRPGHRRVDGPGARRPPSVGAATRGDLIGDMAAVPDAAALRTASDWVALIRKHLDGEIEPRTAAFVMKSGLCENNIAEANAPAYEILEQFLAIFEKPHRGTLRDELNHSYDAAFELLDALDATATDLPTWSDYIESRDALVAFGLGPAIAECERLRKPASHIPHILRLALLRRWADQIVDGDDRLRPGRAADRHRIRTEFQRLDRKLVQYAAADVINACAERRPKSTAGGAGFIRQQAQLMRRHKPVRTQMRDASEAAQRLKPCFMMSPLSVSQFLPAEMSFDAVIFDVGSGVARCTPPLSWGGSTGRDSTRHRKAAGRRRLLERRESAPSLGAPSRLGAHKSRHRSRVREGG